MSEARSPVISPRWLRCFFVILGTMTLIFPGTILQMIIQVPIEDLVAGQKGGTPDNIATK